MKVPLLDIAPMHADVGAALEDAVLEVVRSGHYILGPKVTALEAELAEHLGLPAEQVIGVSSGTDALLVSLMAHGVGPGDVVAVPAFSFFATAGVVSRLGATPSFIDINPETYCIDADGLAAWMQDERRVGQTRVLMPVHLFGGCADVASLRAQLGSHPISIIEDAAQAIDSRYGGRAAGTAAQMGCYSFFPSKNLGGLGDGGLVVTDSPESAEHVRRLRVHGAKPKYYHSLIGGNFRIDAIQAAALRAKLPYLKKWTQQRRENAARYDEAFAELNLQRPHREVAGEYHCFNQYTIAVDGRDGVQAKLGEAGIGTAIYYPVPFHLQPCFAHLGHPPGSFPNAEQAARRVLSLPVFPGLSREQQDHVIEQVKRAVGDG